MLSEQWKFRLSWNFPKSRNVQNFPKKQNCYYSKIKSICNHSSKNLQIIPSQHLGYQHSVSIQEAIWCVTCHNPHMQRTCNVGLCATCLYSLHTCDVVVVNTLCVSKPHKLLSPFVQLEFIFKINSRGKSNLASTYAVRADLNRFVDTITKLTKMLSAYLPWFSTATRSQFEKQSVVSDGWMDVIYFGPSVSLRHKRHFVGSSTEVRCRR